MSIEESMKTKWPVFLAGVIAGLTIALMIDSMGKRGSAAAQYHYGPTYAAFDITDGYLKPVWPKPDR